MRCVFLYNPNSGKGALGKKLESIKTMLLKKFDCVDVVETTSSEDLETQARLGAEKYDVILFSGGDGTFHRVLQGVGTSDVKLGYIPSGTVNDVSRSLGIPKNIKKAVKTVTDGRVAKLDCILVNGNRYCMYIAAAGAFTPVTYNTPQKQKRALGKVAYAIEGLRHNMKFDIFPIKIVCDGREHSATAVFAVVLNGRSVGGFSVNKHASMADGVLEIAVVKQAKRPTVTQKIGAYFSMAALFLQGVKVRRKNIECFRGSGLRIETTDDVVWDFDGEEGVRGTIDIEVLPKHVNLFVPYKKKI